MSKKERRSKDTKERKRERYEGVKKNVFPLF